MCRGTSDDNGYAIGYGGSACRYELCTDSYSFSLPTGNLDIDVSVGAWLDAECFTETDSASCNDQIMGTGNFELALSLPDLAPIQTPLPATLPLFATGLAGLGLLGWRRKRKAQAVG